MNTPLIELKKVELLINASNGNSSPLIHDINLNITPNEIIGILGPSGSGKTSLLKVLALLFNIKFLTGKYYYNGQEITLNSYKGNMQEIRRNLLFIHQFPVLFKGTVKYNIHYGLKLRKQIVNKEYLNSLLSSFKLDDLLNRNVSTLSGGEKQRVCVLRAMALKPKVLLLDEPTQNLDPANIKNIEKNIKHYQEKENGTVIIVTHNLFQARRITDRTAVLINGTIVEVGKTKELFKSPKNSQTNDFLTGKMVF